MKNAARLISSANTMLQRKPSEEDLEAESWKNEVAEYLKSIGEHDKAERVQGSNLTIAFGEAESDMCIINWNTKTIPWIIEILKKYVK